MKGAHISNLLLNSELDRARQSLVAAREEQNVAATSAAVITFAELLLLLELKGNDHAYRKRLTELRDATTDALTRARLDTELHVVAAWDDFNLG